MVPARKPSGDQGSAVAEFAMVSVMLVFLFFGVLQIGLYLHIRNVLVASAAAGARAAANADADPSKGQEQAEALIEKGVGTKTAEELTCVSSEEDDTASGLPIVRVRCSGTISAFFVPVARFLPIDASGRSLKEGA